MKPGPNFPLALGLAVLSAGPALAQDALFSCQFANGKAAALTADESGVTYTFGLPGKAPELVLRRGYADIRVRPWNGVGRSIWEDLTLTNAGYSYVLWGSADRMEENAPMEAGVIVEQGGEEIARLDCLSESLSYAVFSFADAYEAAGYCWNFDTQSWDRGCE